MRLRWIIVLTVLLVLTSALQAAAGQIYMNSLEQKWDDNNKVWLFWSSLYIVNPGNGAVQEVGQVQHERRPSPVERHRLFANHRENVWHL